MYFGNIYKYLKENEIKKALIRQIEDNGLQFVYPVFQEAWASSFWRTRGYDGATFIQDTVHPSIDVFLHDYFYRCFGGSKKADVIFYKMQQILKDKKAKRNYYGIRIFGSYFRLNHWIKGNRKELSENSEKLYLYLVNNF